jgi:hypothetical protein
MKDAYDFGWLMDDWQDTRVKLIKERDDEWKARVDGAVTRCTEELDLQHRESRREGWESGIRALASLVTDRGVYHPALENAVENLIAQGPK